MFALRRYRSLTVLAALAALALRPGLAAEAGEHPLAPGRTDLMPLAQVWEWRSPRVDVESLRREDSENLNRTDIPLRIGYPMPTDLSPVHSGTWESLPDGQRVWRLRVSTPGARWVVLGFDLFRLQDGGRLWVYDPAEKTVLGPFTAHDVRDHGELWFPPIEGDSLVVELDWAVKQESEEPRLHLGTVSHGYKPFGSIGRLPTEAFGDSGACNIDVRCPLGDDWQDEKRGVVMLLSGGSGFCSASLINTTANDCRPYVLTAAHCTAGPSTSFGFNFERPACNSGTPPPATTQMITGATVLANFSSSDFTLLQMSSAPPASFGTYFNGWSRDTNPATETWPIHHPSADAKKISHDASAPINGSSFGSNHWRVVNYEQGTTEPGSSGSPLFDQNSRIVGQLHGGTASCTSITWDEFGKVDASWVGGGTPTTRLSNWLDPTGTGVLFADGIDHQTCLFQPAGAVTFVRDVYACADMLSISLHDDNLRGAPTQAVTVSSPTEPAGEMVTLSAASPGSGIFVGTFPIATVPAVPGDGKLSVSAGETVTVSYLDQDDGTGQTVTVTDTALVDCAAPLLTNVHAINVTGNTADVLWNTDEASNSRVHYGLAPPGGLTQSDAALVVSHSVHLTGLSACSTYVYGVDSTDAAGNTGANDNGGAYYTFQTGQNVNPTYTYSGPPVVILDPPAAPAVASIVVSDTKPIQDVNVKFNVTHTFDGDLDIFLVAPNGTRIELSTDNGAGGDNFVNTVLDDEAAGSITGGTAPFTGSFKPEGSLAALDGMLSNGTWKLEITDDAGADTGTLDNWSITFAYPPQACGASLEYSSSDPIDSCSGSGGGGGNFVIEPGEDVSLPIDAHNNGTDPTTGISAVLTTTTAGVTITAGSSSYASIPPDGLASSNTPFGFAVGAGVPCGTTASFRITFTANQGSWQSDFTLPVGASGNQTNTHNSTDVPRVIADVATTTSTLSVATTATILDVNVGVTLTHTFDADLDIFLIGPNGTRVELTTDNGSSGDNFTGTTFDDEAATPVTAGTAPFSGPFKPEGLLSSLDGIPANGTWTLEITDDLGQDSGTLLAWSIVLTTSAPPVCNSCTPGGPPGEVLTMTWTSETDLEWTAAASATSYNIYRGGEADLPNLYNSNVDSCKVGATSSLSATIPGVPSAGSIDWYLIRAENGSGEGPAGFGTGGARIQNSSGGCP